MTKQQMGIGLLLILALGGGAAVFNSKILGLGTAGATGQRQGIMPSQLSGKMVADIVLSAMPSDQTHANAKVPPPMGFTDHAWAGFMETERDEFNAPWSSSNIVTYHSLASTPDLHFDQNGVASVKFQIEVKSECQQSSDKNRCYVKKVDHMYGLVSLKMDENHMYYINKVSLSRGN